MINLIFNPKTCDNIDFDSFPKEIKCWFDSMMPDNDYVYLIDDEWFLYYDKSFVEFARSCNGKIWPVGNKKWLESEDSTCE